MLNFILAYHPGGKMPDSPEEGAKQRQEWEAWIADLGDAAVNPGTPLGMSKLVSANGVSEHEGPNSLMGYTIVKANSLDAALGIAKGCPFLEMGTIEVAEVMEM